MSFGAKVCFLFVQVVGAPSDVSVANLTVISELWISPWVHCYVASNLLALYTYTVL